MKIYLIRHAEPDYHIDGLTPKGKTEAELLARRLSRYTIRDCYVSPLNRARMTAEPALKLLGKEAEVLPWLQEFRGVYPDPETGVTRHVAWDLKPRVWTAFAGSMTAETWLDNPLFKGGNVREIWQETTEGIDALLGRYGYRKDGPVWLCDRNGRDAIALFCHFGMAMAILAYLTDQSPMVLWHHAVCLPSSVTEIRTEERIPGEISFRLVRLGDLAHLEDAGEPFSTHALYPEQYTGIDSTNPYLNGN